MDISGRVLPIRTRAGLSLTVVPPSCVVVASKPADAAVAAVTSDFQKFSPFMAMEEGVEHSCQVDEGMGGAMDPRAFLPHHIRGTPGTVPLPGHPRGGTNGSTVDYGSYYVPAAEYYSSLAKEHSLESQDSSTLSSPPSDGLAPPTSQPPAGAAAPDSLFPFSIGKILEDEGGMGDQRPDHELGGFYKGVTYAEGADRPPLSPPPLHPPEQPDLDGLPADQRQIRRIIMSVNDKWHYCHNSDVLVGSRAMRDRHLRLLGYVILQLPYHELEKLNGIEEVKQYLHKKLLDVTL